MPKHLIHAHSSVVTEGQPKLPTTDRIEYGELAVNFADGHETISLKNSNDEIVTFSSDDIIQSFIDVNNIEDITVVESNVDGGANNITIEFTDPNTPDKQFSVYNGHTGSTGNGIQSITEVRSALDGGDNVITVNYTNGNTATLHTKNGSKGTQGDTAVFDPTDPSAPTFVMANNIGNSTTKSMTQKAITDITNATVLSYDLSNITTGTTYFYFIQTNANGDYWRSGGSINGRLIPLINETTNEPLYEGCSVIVGPSSQQRTAKFAFVAQKPSSSGGSASEAPVYYATGCSRVDVTEEYFAEIPQDAKYIWFSHKENSTDYSYPDYLKILRPYKDIVMSGVDEVTEEIAKVTPKTLHVDAANGSDSNDGLTKATALKTFAKALEISGSEVDIVLHGDTTERFETNSKRKVTLTNASGEKARIIRGYFITSATSEGNDIYSFDIATYEQETGKTFGGGRNLDKYWIFQHNTPDLSTEISEDERHSLQRGLKYRCDSALMQNCATSADLQSATGPAYYYDSTNNILYFKLANGTTLANNPVVLPNYNDPSIYVTNCEFNATGIECLYGFVGLMKCFNSTLTDCASKYSYGGRNDGSGAYIWWSSRNINFVRCEAARCINGTSGTGGGDGFNAHLNETVSESNLRRMTATLIDCWAHDNNDDGCSDHSRSEMTIIGGLYEYCGKGGITPSNGSCNTIYNTILRRNTGAGIRYTIASPNEYIGIGGCVTAIGCISCDNAEYGYNLTNDSGVHDTNIMTLINCTAQRNGISGYNAEVSSSQYASNVKMKLVNCQWSGIIVNNQETTSILTGNGPKVIENTQLVTVSQ